MERCKYGILCLESILPSLSRATLYHKNPYFFQIIFTSFLCLVWVDTFSLNLLKLGTLLFKTA